MRTFFGVYLGIIFAVATIGLVGYYIADKYIFDWFVGQQEEYAHEQYKAQVEVLKKDLEASGVSRDVIDQYIPKQSVPVAGQATQLKGLVDFFEPSR